jgi:hypothetical protein
LQGLAQTKAATKLQHKVNSLQKQKEARKRIRCDDIAQAKTSAIDHLTPWKQQQASANASKKLKSVFDTTATNTQSCDSGSSSSSSGTVSNTSSVVHSSSAIHAKGNSILSSTIWSIIFQYVGAWGPYSDTIECITTTVHDVANLSIVCSDTYIAAIQSGWSVISSECDAIPYGDTAISWNDVIHTPLQQKLTQLRAASKALAMPTTGNKDVIAHRIMQVCHYIPPCYIYASVVYMMHVAADTYFCIYITSITISHKYTHISQVASLTSVLCYQHASHLVVMFCSLVNYMYVYIQIRTVVWYSSSSAKLC